MKSKKIRSLFCAAALTLSLAACGSKTSDYSGQTITGEITDIDGTAVTMQLGELSAGGMPSHDVSDSSDSGQTPPDKPDGETQSGNSSSEDHTSSDSSEPPEKPDSQSGSSDDSQPPEKPDGQSSDTQSSDSNSQPPEKPDGEALSSTPGGMGSSFTAGEESVTLGFANAEITKNDESIELSDLAEGDILTVEVGIQTTGGGTTSASNLVVETSGNSSAAIRSDRGGGTVNVSGGAYTSNGYNSPAVYSTADITVKNANLTANNSEALVIEGKNSITLEDCYVTGNMSDTKGTSSSENVHNVMIYQSMSGDADVGTSVFSMTGGSLVGNSGDMFYITNTHCLLTLSGVNIVNNDADGALLRVVGNSASRGWGMAGSNGAQVEFAADGQTLSGDIIVDTISNLTMTMKNGSTFTGTINIVDNAEGGTAVSDNAIVAIESGCTWNLTGNCTLTSLTNNGTINFNGYTITLADGTVLK